MDLEIGDIVEIIPDNLPASETCWLEGKGLILSIDEQNIELHMFFLNKISKKNFSEIYLENTKKLFPIAEVMKHCYLKLIS
jgi:hypothetical protein